MTPRVSEMFTSIQGEGRNVGVPSGFIRLAECNLHCSFCDTDFSMNDYFTLEVIITEIAAMYRSGIRHFIITGGEPTLQPSLILTLAHIIFAHENVAIEIETNGSVVVDWSHLLQELHGRGTFSLTVSPKLFSTDLWNGGLSSIPLELHHNCSVKLVIPFGYSGDLRSAIDRVLAILPVGYENVWLQAEHPKDVDYINVLPEIRYLTHKILAERLPCRISVQLHKLLGVL